MNVLSTCVYVYYMYAFTHEGQKREANSLELELLRELSY